ncbi:Integrase [Lentibacillus sp. JNUCC-1]|uniref:tyrosine-type recombinase/integrase n=1 Tax=Lentibacillus sp. JNUCC-1 TaxID=2654513 RepID=UPI0012E7FE48|nr:site-specific integrase [Lentibacillus sp. JNUCC-1]MUV39431.1 Integrase [Lentibacillus sp. JNUCC-1]
MRCFQVQLKSGKKRWECIADGPPHPSTGKRNQIARRGRTKGEAKQRVLDEIELQSAGLDRNASKHITFDAAANMWYETYSKSGKKNSTLLRRRKEIKSLNQYMAKQLITEVTHYLYQTTIDKLANDYAETTINGIHDCANQIFRFSIRNKWIKENPATDIVKPKKQKTVEQIKQDSINEKYFDRDELREFLTAASTYGLKYDKERFYALAFSGMRPGELCALQKHDLLFETNEIDISKTIYTETNNMKDYDLTPPKSYGSVRTINMEPFVMDMLKNVIHENDKHKMKYRKLIEGFHDKDFVFARQNGYPFYTIQLNIRMKRLLKKTSIKKHATPHIFRHTHISMMTEAGIDLPTIMERVGHEDAHTTMRIYTHVTKKMKRKAPEKLSNLYKEILQK